MSLSITVSMHTGVEVLGLNGRLDATGAGILDTWAAEQSHIPMVFDITNVDYISSIGIRSLLKLDKALRAIGQKPVFAGMTSSVRDILSITGLLEHWVLYTTVDEATGALAGDVASRPESGFMTPSGAVYQHSYGGAPLGLTLFDAQDVGSDTLPISLTELGFAFGDGGFGPSGALADEAIGAFVATGELIAVGLPSGETDVLASIAPERTFAFVKWAARITGSGSHIYDLSRSVRIGSLQRDLMHFASTRGAETYLAVIHCTLNGQAAVVIGAKGIAGDRWLALVGSESQLEAPPSDAQASLTALGEATQLTVTVLDTNTELSGLRIWFESNPAIRDGAEDRLQIDVAEPLHPSWELIVRSIFIDEARVRLTRLTGGFTASTFAADTYDRDGRRTLPTVLKISPYAITMREEQAYRLAVRPFILNNSTVLFGKAAHGDFAGLRYNFLGITGVESKLRPLEDIYLNGDIDQAIGIIEQTTENVLEPWYGQARIQPVQPFRDHDPRELFRTLPELGLDVLGIDPDTPKVYSEVLGRDVLNPYWFIKHRYDAQLDFTVDWPAGITHGDLNLNNILVDERLNLYVIDFSETRTRSVASDFARLEPIALLQWSRVSEPGDEERLLRTVAALLDGSVYCAPDSALLDGAEDRLYRALRLTAAVRRLAATRVGDDSNQAAYLLPLFQWMVPIVAFRGTEIARMRVSAIASGLVMERVLAALGIAAE